MVGEEETTESRMEFLHRCVPRYRIHQLADKYSIEEYDNINDLLQEVLNSISNAEFTTLKKDCIFELGLTIHLYRDRKQMISKRNYISKTIEAKKLLNLTKISNGKLSETRESNPPSEDEIILRKIVERESLWILEYDFLYGFEYRNKKGQMVSVERLETAFALLYPEHNIIAITTPDMDIADKIKVKLEELFDTEIFVLRFYEEDLLQWKLHSSRLSSSSISVMDDEEVGTERLTSKRESDIRKSPIYISAYNRGYETNIYSKKALEDCELGFGLNLNQAKIYFRSIIDLNQLNEIIKIAAIILSNRQDIRETTIKSEIELPAQIESKEHNVQEAYKLIKLIIESPSKLNNILKENKINLDTFVWLLQSLVSKDLMIVDNLYLCPSCNTHIDEPNPFDTNACISCEWNGKFDELVKHKIYSFNSEKSWILRDFSRNELGIFRIIGEDIRIELPTYDISKIEEFNVDEIEEEYTKKELKEMSKQVLELHEDYDKRKDDREDLTGMFCDIFDKKRLPHGTEEIADSLCKVTIEENKIPAAIVIKSNKDTSNSTDFRNKIISQVARCISDSDAKIIFLTSTRPVTQRIIAQLKALCAKSKVDFYYLETADLTKIFLKHNLICEECGKVCLGNELCSACQKKEEHEESLIETKKKIKTLEWDAEKGQLATPKLKELTELKRKLKSLEEEK